MVDPPWLSYLCTTNFKKSVTDCYGLFLGLIEFSAGQGNAHKLDTLTANTVPEKFPILRQANPLSPKHFYIGLEVAKWSIKTNAIGQQYSYERM